jgi:hypothetical protein
MSDVSTIIMYLFAILVGLVGLYTLWALFVLAAVKLMPKPKRPIRSYVMDDDDHEWRD